MAKWRYFAAKELPKVIRELRIPCAKPVRVTGMVSCPRHGEPLGKVSRMCLSCHKEAWDEVGRRYVAQGRPVTPKATDLEEVTMSTTEIVQGELLPDVYEATPVPSTLFGTSDPTLALERMALMARLLVDVVRERRLVMKIAGNEYLLAPGWSVLAGMTGLAPYTAWTRPTEDGTGYIARVEVRRVVDGTVISAAEQVCTRSERKWAKAEDHALMGMAQTRATSRALRGPLAQVVELAGYKGTPAEEVTEEPKAPKPTSTAPTKDQVERIRDLIATLTNERPEVDWREFAQLAAGVPGKMLTTTLADVVIDTLEAELGAESAA